MAGRAIVMTLLAAIEMGILISIIGVDVLGHRTPRPRRVKNEDSDIDPHYEQVFVVS
jgi:hypothetical protein